MRESIGGAALMYMFAILLIVLSVVIGITVNYMAAYRANNYLVSRIEQTNGAIRNDNVDVDQYVKNHFGYNLKSDKVGVCCVDIAGNSYMNGGAVVRIYTYLNFRLPLIPTTIKIWVRGETRTIQGTNCTDVMQHLTSLGSCPIGN